MTTVWKVSIEIVGRHQAKGDRARPFKARLLAPQRYYARFMLKGLGQSVSEEVDRKLSLDILPLIGVFVSSTSV